MKPGIAILIAVLALCSCTTIDRGTEVIDLSRYSPSRISFQPATLFGASMASASSSEREHLVAEDTTSIDWQPGLNDIVGEVHYALRWSGRWISSTGAKPFSLSGVVAAAPANSGTTAYPDAILVDISVEGLNEGMTIRKFSFNHDTTVPALLFIVEAEEGDYWMMATRVVTAFNLENRQPLDKLLTAPGQVFQVLDPSGAMVASMDAEGGVLIDKSLPSPASDEIRKAFGVCLVLRHIYLEHLYR